MADVKSMTEGSPLKLMTRFAIPLLLSNLLQLFYTLADSAVVGRLLGVEAFAAVGATGSLNWMVLSTSIGTTIGFGTLFAQRYGAGDKDGLRKMFSSSVPLSLALGFLIAAAGIFGGREMLALLRTPAELMDGAYVYLAFWFGGMPIAIMNLLLQAMLRAMGDSKSTLRAMIFSTVLNIALDYALVLPFGIAGVAAATVTAQFASAVYCGWRLRKIPEARFNLKDIRRAEMWALFKIGFSLGLRSAVIEVGSLFMQVLVNGYGTEYVAGMAAAKRMYSLLLIAGGAMEASVGVFVAQNYGAGNNERVKDGVRTGFTLMIVSALIISALTIIFGRNLLGLLVTGEPALVEGMLDVGQAQLNVMAFGLPVVHMLFLYRSALTGIGNTVIPMLTGFAELAGKFASLLIFAAFWGIWGAYLADATGWVLGAALAWIAYLIIKKKAVMK